MHIDDRELGAFLLDAGLISRTDLDLLESEAEAKQVPFRETLIVSGKVSEESVRRSEAYLLGISYIHLANEKIPKSVITKIPEPIARKKNIIAYKETADTIEVAILDTDALEDLAYIKILTGKKVLPRLTDLASMQHALLSYQKELKGDFGDLIHEDLKKLQVLAEESEEEELEEGGQSAAEDPAVIRLVDTLLQHALLQHATDVHIEPHESELVVRYRVAGALHDAMILPKYAESLIALRLKFLSRISGSAPIAQDGRFKITLGGEKASIRLSIVPTEWGQKMVLRILRDTAEGFTLESLGFHGDGLEKMHEALRKQSGLIVVAGPEDSGKTTLLYTLIDILHTSKISIATIEKEIEYRLPKVMQTKVQESTGFNTADTLRKIMRQDTDIIMIAEITDGETARLAMRAALSGKLVLAGVKKDSSEEVLEMFKTFAGKEIKLVSAIKAIVSLRLAPKLGAMKKGFTLSKAQLTTLGASVDLPRVLEVLKEEKVISPKTDFSKIEFFDEDTESNAGFVGVQEIMTIHEGHTDKGLTLREDAIFKAAQGQMSLEVALGITAQ